MSRKTVEGSLALDAHIWAEESAIDGTATERLAALGLAGVPEVDIEDLAGRVGLHSLTLAGRWPVHLRGIVWATIEAQGGRPSRVLVGNWGFLGAQAPAPLTLDWTTARGTPSRLPVFHCPGCSRRARYLYLPTKWDTFRCRACHRLAYRAQNESRSRFERTLNRCWSHPLDLEAYKQAKALFLRKGVPDRDTPRDYDAPPGEEDVSVRTTTIIRWRRWDGPEAPSRNAPWGVPRTVSPMTHRGGGRAAARAVWGRGGLLRGLPSAEADRGGGGLRRKQRAAWREGQVQ